MNDCYSWVNGLIIFGVMAGGWFIAWCIGFERIGEFVTDHDGWLFKKK